tara:strand:- start:269 stop:1015 length:747 start_codon:yes stop_codon:yes gene_type:complete
MAIPSSRSQLISFCKRKLGHGVIDINISTDQEDDIIDEALQYYRDYHVDAIQRTYLKHQLTSTDITNKYISISDAITGVVKVFPVGGTNVTNNSMFNVKYQLRLSDLFDLADVEMIHYSMVMEHLEFIDNLLVGTKTFDYNRHMDRLYIYMDWDSDINVDDYLVLEVYQVIDPSTYTNVYNDLWLKRYTTALMKKQWGQNLKKFDSITLPGGITYNGQSLYDEAVSEIENLESTILLSHDTLPTMIIG